MDAFIVLIILLFVILYISVVMSKKKHNYWKNKNVAYIKPLPILGNYGKHILLQENLGKLIQKMCQKFPNAPYFGAFFGTEPVLIVKSPEMLKLIMAKDIYYFSGREVSKYDSEEILMQSLFFIGGDKWKVTRQMMTPLFSSSKMKNMFKLIEKCCYLFEDMLDNEISINNVINTKYITGRYVLDCVSTCGFGVESNTINKPQNNTFLYIANEIFRTTNYRGFKIIFRAIWPKIFYSLRFKCFPSTLEAFFFKLIKSVFESRNYKPSLRNDFIDLILNVKENGVVTTSSMRNIKTGFDEKKHFKMDDGLLVAQCFQFFAAGVETSAMTLSFTLLELARHPDIQKRATEEVDEFLRRHGNKLDYECINELPYIEACVYETLRMYPVLGNLSREVMDDYTFPDGLQLDKGTRIHIPVHYMHHNPEYFVEPEIYKPERFYLDNKKDIKPYTYFPYGEGGRICIGKRLSKILMFTGLVTFLKKYRVELAQKMPQTIPLECRTFVNQPRDMDLLLKVYPREEWEKRIFIRS